MVAVYEVSSCLMDVTMYIILRDSVCREWKYVFIDPFLASRIQTGVGCLFDGKGISAYWLCG